MYLTTLKISENQELGMKLCQAVKHILWKEGYKVKAQVKKSDDNGNRHFEVCFTLNTGKDQIIKICLDKGLK